MAELNLGKQVGPLPLGGWLVVIAGGLGIGYIINRNAAKGSAEPDIAQLTESDVGAGGPQYAYTPPVTPDDSDAAPETNQSWAFKAKNWLIAQNHDPVVADNAVRKYISGLALSTVERALITLVLAQFGAPPDELPAVEQPEPEPTPPAVKPVLPVTNLQGFGQRRAVMFTWNYDRKTSPIGGFQVTVKDLKRGKIVRRLYLPASSRSYKYTVPASWNRRTMSKLQFWIIPFGGGWETINKRYGPGRGANAVPII